MRTKGITLGWLVGAAARKAVGGAMTAAALLFAGCSSEDDTIAGEPKTTEPTAQATVIRVTVGAGISDGEAATRSTVTQDGSTRTLQFSAGDKLYVWRELAGDVTKHLAGELTMKDGSPTDGGTQASFEGELTVYDDKGAAASYDFGATNPLAGSTATLLHAGMTLNTDYSIDGATKAVTFADATGVAATVEALMTKGLVVSGLYDAENDRFPLAAGQPILSCTIAGLKAGATYTMTYSASIDDGTYREHTTGSVATDASGTAMFACFGGTRLYDGSQWVNNLYHRIRLTNAADAGDTYTVSIGQKEFEGKVYNVSRRFVDLSNASIYSDDYGYYVFLAQNGDILSGTMPTGNNVRIAAGAKVTLHNATIESSNFGIDCDGDVTINLEGANTVSSSYMTGIYCGGTLTIQGSGSLTATGSNGYPGIGGDGKYKHVVIKGGTIVAQGGTGSTYSGAGIGGGGGGTFGNIRIEGGDVTATGGDNAAGIGCGYRQADVTCGTITITGGTVRATGGANAAGIGCGKGYVFSFPNVCGDITISGGTVEATVGTGDCSAIGGAGQFSYSGHILIEGGDVTATNNSKQIPCIGNGYRLNDTKSSVTVTSGITRVAMTNSAETGYQISFFIDDSTVNIGTTNGVNTSLGVNSYNYGTVGWGWNSPTKTWTLTKK